MQVFPPCAFTLSTFCGSATIKATCWFVEKTWIIFLIPCHPNEKKKGASDFLLKDIIFGIGMRTHVSYLKILGLRGIEMLYICKKGMESFSLANKRTVVIVIVLVKFGQLAQNKGN